MKSKFILMKFNLIFMKAKFIIMKFDFTFMKSKFIMMKFNFILMKLEFRLMKLSCKWYRYISIWKFDTWKRPSTLRIHYPSENMEFPLSINLFNQIRLHGSDLLRTANEFCDQHVKLAKTIQMKHFNLRCKRTDVFPKSIVG